MKRSINISALLLLVALSACRQPQAGLIAVIPRTTGTILWEAEHAGVLDAAAAYHYEIYWNGPSTEDDIQRQIDLVDLAIDKHPLGIILAPGHATALISPVQRALRAGIPVVVVDSPLLLKEHAGLSMVINDEERSGALAAARIGHALDGRGSIVVLGIDRNIAGLMARLDSFERHLAHDWPGISIAKEQLGFFRPAQAQQAARDAIAAEPQVRGIFALTSVATHGAVLESRRMQRTDIKIVGCDQDTSNWPRLEGIDALIVENTRQMGWVAVQRIMEKSYGKTAQTLTLVEPALVTAEAPAPSSLPF